METDGGRADHKASTAGGSFQEGRCWHLTRASEASRERGGRQKAVSVDPRFSESSSSASFDGSGGKWTTPPKRKKNSRKTQERHDSDSEKDESALRGCVAVRGRVTQPVRALQLRKNVAFAPSGSVNIKKQQVSVPLLIQLDLSFPVSPRCAEDWEDLPRFRAVLL
jgi:hypothetical protein